ncbi:erythrocyte membrane protein 1, PfEMP1, putative [Plasmodium sp. gorilla clade G2]|uniref:erythrocyte membrane protein 1, PfEMP1, putative n=1 Tax=Plasmodium sp. gorilla clade G2 TaxID=880535 RepID=UPI000D206635|nr:erythrocyte membrane protein 1, PfEMP1, putative [Plasmodium sp. gorilla clade G2]SOV10649.1 erythrocyte membrane protein 1, PfEMP1, putative [Plasmodium sp. gorilla clade G2]
MIKLETNLKAIFKKIHEPKWRRTMVKYASDNGKFQPPYKKLREDWWEANRKEIWEAMTCYCPGRSSFNNTYQRMKSRDDSEVSNIMLRYAPSTGGSNLKNPLLRIYVKIPGIQRKPYYYTLWKYRNTDVNKPGGLHDTEQKRENRSTWLRQCVYVDQLKITTLTISTFYDTPANWYVQNNNTQPSVSSVILEDSYHSMPMVTYIPMKRD